MARATHRVPSWVFNHDYLRPKVSSDTRMRRGEVNTHWHGGWRGGLCLEGKIKSNPGIVVDNMRVMLVLRGLFVRPIVMIGHVNVLQVMRLIFCSDVYRWGIIPLVTVCSAVTGRIS